jgi:uncharacterized protein YjbJ (UPF0337 family)
MVDVSPAEEARKGLLGSLTGKAKEVAGAVLGNDSLAAEGQLQQAEAQTRKDASAREAVAQVEAQEAAQKLAAEQAAADRQREAAEQAAAARLDAAGREAQVQELVVEADVRRDEAVAKREVELDAQQELERSAARTQAQLAQAAQLEASGRREAEQEAARAEAAEQAAARARADADRLAAG